MSSQDAGPNPYLVKALGFLDLAEALYTGSQNHSIMQIYVARARILMAQHRYGEALNLMKCLPSARRSEQSVAAMMAYAAYTIGEPNPNETSSEESAQPIPRSGAGERSDTEEIKQDLLRALFANDGRKLESLVRANTQLVPVLVSVLNRLSGDE